MNIKDFTKGFDTVQSRADRTSAIARDVRAFEPQPSEANVSVDELAEVMECAAVGNAWRGVIPQSGKPSALGKHLHQELQTVEPDPQTTDKLIAATPVIQEPDHQKKELDELISKLNDARRYTIEDARKKGVPMKALIHAATLWLSDDLDDWTAANDTIYSFTSPFGLKQLQYPNKERVFIPDIGKGRNVT